MGECEIAFFFVCFLILLQTWKPENEGVLLYYFGLYFVRQINCFFSFLSHKLLIFIVQIKMNEFKTFFFVLFLFDFCPDWLIWKFLCLKWLCVCVCVNVKKKFKIFFQTNTAIYPWLVTLFCILYFFCLPQNIHIISHTQRSSQKKKKKTKTCIFFSKNKTKKWMAILMMITFFFSFCLFFCFGWFWQWWWWWWWELESKKIPACLPCFFCYSCSFSFRTEIHNSF